MAKYNFEGLISVSMLAALRNLLEIDCATEQGIRSQIRQVELGQKKPKDVGFEVVRIGPSVVMVKIIDENLEKFRLKIMDFISKNAPDDYAKK